METVRLCSARSESLRRTFLDRVSKTDGLHSKSLRPCQGRRVENARRFSSQASTKAVVFVEFRPCRRGPRRPAFHQVPRGEVRSPSRAPLACQCVSLPFPRLPTLPQLTAF